MSIADYPEHDRTSCSDDHPINATAEGSTGCARCTEIAMTGWRPIETAPKDQRIQLWVRDYAVMGEWDADRYNRTPRPYWTNDIARLWGIRDTRANQPRWWRPSPPPPQEV